MHRIAILSLIMIFSSVHAMNEDTEESPSSALQELWGSVTESVAEGIRSDLHLPEGQCIGVCEIVEETIGFGFLSPYFRHLDILRRCKKAMKLSLDAPSQSSGRDIAISAFNVTVYTLASLYCITRSEWWSKLAGVITPMVLCRRAWKIDQELEKKNR